MATERFGRRTFGSMAAGMIGAALMPRPASAQQDGWTPLWDGRTLEGWSTWLRRPEPSSRVEGLARDAAGNYTEPIGSNRDPLQVFTVVPDVDGRPAIRISGEAFGEIRTARSLENYHLRLQFKWGEKKWAPRDAAATPRDSGLLYHVHSPQGENNRTWGRSIEMQIQEHDVGDLIPVGSTVAVRARARRNGDAFEYRYDPAAGWVFFFQSQGGGSVDRCIKQPDAEKPTGQWNTVELVCLGPECIHIVNGQVVMRLYGPQRVDRARPEPLTSGPILLQSEGAEVFYRDLEFRQIRQIPGEFAAP